MSRRPEDVRRDIEQTRDELGETLEAIGDRVAPKKVVGRVKGNVAEKVEGVRDRVSPARIARRSTDGIRDSVRNAKEAVMGSSESNGSRGRSVGTSSRRSLGTGGAARGRAVPPATTDAGEQGGTEQGGGERNPFVIGAVAFGGGLLLGAALKPTDSERKVALRARTRLEPMKQQALETGRSVAEDLKGVAQGGFDEVKQRALEAANQVKEEARSSAGEVKEEARSSGEEIKDEAKASTRQVKGQAAGATRQVKRRAQSAAGQASGDGEGTGTSRTRQRRPRATGSASSTTRRRTSASTAL